MRRLEAAVRGGAEHADEDWHRLRIGLPPAEANVVEVALEIAGIVLGPTAPQWRRIGAVAMEFLAGHTAYQLIRETLKRGWRLPIELGVLIARDTVRVTQGLETRF